MDGITPVHYFLATLPTKTLAYILHISCLIMVHAVKVAACIPVGSFSTHFVLAILQLNDLRVNTCYGELQPFVLTDLCWLLLQRLTPIYVDLVT